MFYYCRWYVPSRWYSRGTLFSFILFHLVSFRFVSFRYVVFPFIFFLSFFSFFFPYFLFSYSFFIFFFLTFFLFFFFLVLLYFYFSINSPLCSLSVTPAGTVVKPWSAFISCFAPRIVQSTCATVLIFIKKEKKRREK